MSRFATRLRERDARTWHPETAISDAGVESVFMEPASPVALIGFIGEAALLYRAEMQQQDVGIELVAATRSQDTTLPTMSFPLWAYSPTDGGEVAEERVPIHQLKPLIGILVVDPGAVDPEQVNASILTLFPERPVLLAIFLTRRDVTFASDIDVPLDLIALPATGHDTQLATVIGDFIGGFIRENFVCLDVCDFLSMCAEPAVAYYVSAPVGVDHILPSALQQMREVTDKAIPTERVCGMLALLSVDPVSFRIDDFETCGDVTQGLPEESTYLATVLLNSSPTPRRHVTLLVVEHL